MTVPNPMLWVPKTYLQGERRSLSLRQPQSFLKVALGLQEVLGIRPSWDELVARLREHSLSQVLGCLGRISGMLDHFAQKQPEGQKRICDGLFGRRGPEVWNGLLEWLRREKQAGAPVASPALFHELQLINLAKVAFLVLDVDQGEDRESLEGLGEALLMLNNLQEVSRRIILG